jgi:hypothetical protein
MMGRAHLLRGEHSQATAALTRSLDLVHEQRWIAFLPWPQTLRAELDLRAGRFDTAADEFERAWVLACQIGDPCWEGMAARGLALLHTERGDHLAAAGWLGEAATRCSRETDRYRWVHAHVLDTMIGTALGRDDRQAVAPLIKKLGTLAARCGMRELVVRTELHRSRLGDPTALAAARLLGAEIDNPALACKLADHR